MGLGYKRVNQELAHPKDLYALHRDDENLSDLIALGAIITFAVGTVVWLILGETPLLGTYFSERQEYLGFFWGVVIQLFMLLFLYWLMDTAPVWPRVAIFCVSLFFGLFLAVPRVVGLEEIWQKMAYFLLAIYSFSNAGLAIRQALKLAPSPGATTIGSKFDNE